MIKIFLVALSLLFWPQISQAGFLDNLACIEEGNCGLQEVVYGLIYLIRLMLGGMGAVALVYFVIGGLHWVTSGGSQEKVKKGRDIMINTVFALALAFSSYIILDFFVNKVLGVKPGFTGVQTAPVGACGVDPRAENTSCGDNQICYRVNTTTPNSRSECVTECRVYDLTHAGNWQCYRVNNPNVVNTYPDIFEAGLCPGNEYNVCSNMDAINSVLDIINNL